MSGVLARTFGSLAVRNFRLFASGQIVSATGSWMMVVAQDWLVLELTGNSGPALGLVTSFQFAPVLLLTLYGGRLADRFDKRMLLTAANLAAAALALVLALLVVANRVELWQVYVLALGLGVVNSVEVPTRLSFIGELVGPELLPNASALSAAYFSVARVLGPALAGVLLTVLGSGRVMLLNVLSYGATVATLRMVRPAELRRAPRPAVRPHVRDGLRYVCGRRDLVLALALVAAVGLCGMNFQLTLPLMAKTVFHADTAAFGLLSSAFAAGSLLAALATTGRRTRPSARLVTGSALAFGTLELLAGLAPSFGLATALMTGVGFAAIHFAQAANHRVQLGSDPRYRGRVMALYTLILQGSTPLGALGVGWLADHLGARSGLVLGGLGSLAAALAAALLRGRRSAGGRGGGDEQTDRRKVSAPTARTPR